MSDQPGYLAAGTCFVCRAVFTFNPLLVPSCYIDPVTRMPPDLGGDPERARREPLCEDCVRDANEHRVANGLPIIPILPGAYDVSPGLPE